MSDKHKRRRLPTGVRNLDAILRGGLPRGAALVVAGAPGAGKTILTQQICFHNASEDEPVLYFNTLSEPTAKTLRYLSAFRFFDREKFDRSVKFVDLGVILRANGLEEASALVMERVRKVKPAIVVVDSFRVFDDLARSKQELRRFGYELSVQLMAWEATAFLLGEYSSQDIDTNPLFSIVDGLVELSQREVAGEQQRFLQVRKMRGTDHDREEHPFVINDTGIELYAPRSTLRRDDRSVEEPRLATGIPRLDDLLGDGIPRGSSVLLSGVSGTGKTLLLLEFLYRGALAGEKGILFSFEETEERLRANARGLGWALDAQIERGMVEIVFIPQPDIRVESHLQMIRERVERMGALRVAVDSISIFLHKVADPQLAREKVFQLCTVVQNAGAVAFLATDIPYGSSRISRFGVEETVVDGVFLLTSTEEGLERHRYLEIYKLRNTAHLKGRHSMVIGPDGISVFPRYAAVAPPGEAPVAVPRVASGVPGFDELVGGGLLEGSVTLVSGSPGTGKSTIAAQFVLEGAASGARGLYVTLEEDAARVVAAAERRGLPLAAAQREGRIELLHLSHDRALASQLYSLLLERVQASGAKRLVVDSLSQLVPDGLGAEELRQLLFAVVRRLRALGVTCLFTLEAQALFSSDEVTDRAFSPLADNLVVLRYLRLPGEIRPTLTVVKTRGSEHDFGTYEILVAGGVVRIGPRIGEPSAPEPGNGRGRGRKTRSS